MRQISFAPLSAEDDEAVRKIFARRDMDSSLRNEMLARLDRARKIGARGYPMGLTQSTERTEIFERKGPFAYWKEPVHGNDPARYAKNVLVPYLSRFACPNRAMAEGIAARASQFSFYPRTIDIPGLARTMLEKKCFRAMRLHRSVIRNLKRARDANAEEIKDSRARKPAPR